MNARFGHLLILLPLLTGPAHAQESVRDLSSQGQHSKLLAPGQIDRWVFEGEKGETIVAHVTSREFDPILELSDAASKNEKVLLEVDDPGNESRFSMRLPEKGRYEIRVHAFKFQGGGNYVLRVSRFHASPLTIGQPVIGTFDRSGKSYHYFQGAKDQILIPELKGGRVESWKALDFKGRETKDWAGTVLVEDNGECSLIVSGPADFRYNLLVREATKRDHPDGNELAGKLQPGEMVVCNLQGKPGAFRLLEVEKKGEMLSRLLYAPQDKSTEQRIAQPGEKPELTLLPISSRGTHLRFAAILGREGRYQLQLLAQASATYHVTARDPSLPIAWGSVANGSLPVGGAAFYSFKAAPGQLVEASLVSGKFVPVLRLYDMDGGLVGSSRDDADGLACHIAHTIVNDGIYRLQVASLGDGGGGDFSFSLREAKLGELRIGGRGRGTLEPGATDSWAFSGNEGATVILSVRSSSFEPSVSLRSPDGVLLATEKGNTTTGSTVVVTLPKAGRYTVSIAPAQGGGEYTVRLIDGD
jgi:hypothetical protein